MIRRAIARAGRPMVLSLSPGPMNLANAQEVSGLAQMWRISDDIWDVWTTTAAWPMSVKSQFARTAEWAKYAGPGHWPDADMLPVGEMRPSPGWGEPRSSRLTQDEQRTLLSLWSMARSPLILGANLTLLDDWTKRLLTAREILRIDQTAEASREVAHAGDVIAWTADLPGGERALAVFNVGDTPAQLDAPLTSYGLSDREWSAKDAWTEQGLGAQRRFKALLAPHGCMVWMLR
jgi:alpha-galactosidase